MQLTTAMRDVQIYLIIIIIHVFYAYFLFFVLYHIEHDIFLFFIPRQINIFKRIYII